MQALAGARQVHEFDRRAEETAAWVAEKEAALAASGGPPRQRHARHAQARALAALKSDLDAIAGQHDKLQQEAERYPSSCASSCVRTESPSVGGN